jgi:fatty-acyl-CoA synthase
VLLTNSYLPADRSVDLVETSVGDLLLSAAAECPDRVALVAGTAAPGRSQWTYSELATAAVATARELLSRHEPGDRVAIWAPNIPQWEIFQFGAALAGLTLVTINPAYRATEVRHVLANSRCSEIALVPEHRGSDLVAVLASIRDDLPGLQHVLDLSTWIPSPGTVALPAVDPASPAMIQYTSGTTGVPKGALLPHRGVVNNARLFARRFAIAPDSVWLNPLPMFHVGGCEFAAMGAIWGRSAHVLFTFDAALALRLIEQERAVFFPAVPTMLLAMMEHPDFTTTDLSSLEVVMSGGTTVPPEVVRRVEDRFGVRYGSIFGQTEVSGVICQSYPGDTLADKTERVGRPLEQTEVKICDETGIPVPCGQVGEVRVRGFGVMLGYVDAPQQTAEAITSDGWLRTGDLGTMDDRGYVQVTGRLKEMIIRGGENVYPREVEAHLSEHPGVGETAVVGVPDERWGEEIAAFVRPAPGASLTADELAAFLRARIAPSKVPRQWYFVDELPVTPSGKVQKFVLRDGVLSGAFTQFVLSAGGS